MSPAASPLSSFFFFFNDTAPTEIYPLSLHDALPIWPPGRPPRTVPAIPSATLYTYLLQIGVRGYRKSGGSARSGGARGLEKWNGGTLLPFSQQSSPDPKFPSAAGGTRRRHFCYP